MEVILMPLVICLMGPTATGKTDLAIELAKLFPVELISVDSAMVYRGMDIGTAKPDKKYPHYLIDICNPDEIYSAGRFCQDVLDAIKKIEKNNHIPLLVGGTMLYFRALQKGLSELPKANSEIREKIKNLKNNHAYLKTIDAETAARLHPNDTQRIERAIEVYEITGIPLSQFHQTKTNYLENYQMINIGLITHDREKLRTRIRERFYQMLKNDFIEEVKKLMIYKDYPSMKSVGYYEMSEYLAGHMDYDTAIEKATIATQQLAKRQMTWLRSWENITLFDYASETLLKDLDHFLQPYIAPR